MITLLSLSGCKKDPPVSGVTGTDDYRLVPRAVALSEHCKGYYECLPGDYAAAVPGTRYPLLIFFHGGGEVGQDSTELDKVLKNGPLKLVKEGSFPGSFYVNGKNYRFIIFAPQLTSAEDTYPAEIDAMVEYAKQHYSVDASRIYMTGLSFGAGLCWNYVGQNASYARKIAAMVPIAAYINEARPEFKVDAAKAHIIAASNLPIWSTHNRSDNVCPLDWITNAHNLVKNSSPAPHPLPRLTVFDAYGHEGWTTTYDPSFRENNLNIYQWMLQYHR